MKYIKLATGQQAIVDDDDFERVNHFKWYFLPGNQTEGGYAYNHNAILMHRFILNAPKGLYVDHINRNKLDNRKENLRLVTPLQSHFNTKMSSRNTSGYRGVTFHKEKQKWMAQLHIGKMIFLGYFGTPKEASIAREKELEKRHIFS